jgi:hypothetical protein
MVILRSLLGMLGLWLELGSPGRTARLLRQRVDRTAAAITLLAAVVSVIAYARFSGAFGGPDETLSYPDAVSHLLIARRTVDATTPGAAQLGGVWLPLPHLLALPGIWIDGLYYSGLAASLTSMAAYVLAVRYVFLTGRGLTGSTLAGVVAAALVGGNPNVLYMQSTPMTEMLLIASIAATVYHLMRWCQTGAYQSLAATAVAALCASLTRYEGWVLVVAVLATVGYVSWRRPGRARQVEADSVFYSFLAFAGIAGWLVWNAAIFHSPLYFQNGAFAKPSLWVISKWDVAIGHWDIAIRAYLYAMQDDIGTVTLVLGGIGLAHHLVVHRLGPATIAPIPLLAFLPFFVYALHDGQRPLRVPQINGDLYNVRFGLLMVLPAALFTAHLVSALERGLLRARLAGRTLGVGVALAALGTAAGGPITLQEARQRVATERPNVIVAAWLRAHYDGGPVLMESFGNDTTTFGSRIPTSRIVYEGSYRQWEPALRSPARYGIRWIYMRSTPGNADDVWTALHGSPVLGSYTLVYTDQDRAIYKSRGALR